MRGALCAPAALFCLILFLPGAVPGAEAQSPACDHGSFVVAVDAGHSPDSPGATSARGVPEYEFNARLAKLIVARLHARGFTRAFIVSGEGRALSPAERAGAANGAGADLLISVHHDSVQPVYLSEWSYGGNKLLYCDRFKGYSLFISGVTEGYGRALLFARILAGRMISGGLSPSHYHAEPIPGEARDPVDQDKGIYRDDSLTLLKEAHMPAVLMEAGVIVNRDEEAMLEDGAHREKIAEAVVSSVEEYCPRVEGGRPAGAGAPDGFAGGGGAEAPIIAKITEITEARDGFGGRKGRKDGRS